jgi:hypothetical protein
MDSHADTVVLGKNCVILAYTGRECDVSPYTDYYDAIKGVPIVTGATAWTCQADGETYILVFNEALWMGETMDHSLINPNQLRHFGIYVQDNPYGDVQMHLSTEDTDTIIPLTAEGTTIFLQGRTPTDKELQQCRHITLTSKSPWNPHDVLFPRTETSRRRRVCGRTRFRALQRIDAEWLDDDIAARLISANEVRYDN